VDPQNSQSLLDSLKPLDEHDFNGDSPEGVSSQEEMTQAIENALKEGGIIASRLGVKQPRAIAELFEPKIDWRQALREFVQSSVRGSDEYTWRKFNKRMMANDLYLPTTENESMGELVVAIDTSGSIGQEELTEFATELVAICDTVTPERIRVVWWDYDVHGEQRFNPEDYGSIKSLLKPQGGGGTRVSCVSEYIEKEHIDAEAIVVFTDGYTESDPEWNISTPSLFMVTENKNFKAPLGSTIVFYDN
jgi:predicted metal-dependent peptidase